MVSYRKNSGAVGLLFVAITFSMSLAPHPAYGNEVIQACVKPDGTLHLIGDEFTRQACRNKEVLVEWSTGEGIDARVTALEDQVSALEGHTVDLETRTTGLEGDMTALGTDVTGLADRVTVLEQAPRGQLLIIDATGQVVGPVLDFLMPGAGTPLSRLLRQGLSRWYRSRASLPRFV